MRKGSLTDEQTLALYNEGESLITLAIHEAMTVFGIASRCARARKAVGLSGVPRAPSEYPPIDSIEALITQMNALTRHIKRMSKLEVVR